MSIPPLRRVLSIQSHVAHGYVGNRAAVFPLQLLGFEVDFINSVQFSNHTGYPLFKGMVHTGEQLWEVISGMEANGLLQYSHLVTGYIGSRSLLYMVVKVVEVLLKANPGLEGLAVCDPVCGDDGRLYVAADIPQAYAEQLVPLATVMTPNQYEAELLTGRPIRTELDAINACEALHSRGPHTVVITSFCAEGVTDELSVIASTKRAQRGDSWQRLKLTIPKRDAYFTGTGDLLTALLLARLQEHPDNLKLALELAIGSLQGVLAATIEAAGDAVTSWERTAEVCRQRELRLIQNQHLIRDPQIMYHAEELNPAALGGAMG